MLSCGFVQNGPRKVGSFGTALLTIVVTFVSVLGLAGCAGLVASNSTGSGTPSGTPSSLSITTASLPNAQTGTAYTSTLTATGGATPYTWSVATGSYLPAGLSLNASTGALSGTPSQAGAASFTVQVKDSSSTAQTATKLLSVTIAAANPNSVSILSASIPNGQVGVAYSVALTAAGGSTPYTWSVAAGSLPAGLALNSSTGLLSGTPTQAGAVSFTIQVKDSSSTAQTASKALSVTISPVGVAPLSISTSSLTNGHAGVAYSATLAATGGTTPYSWSVAAGSLPAGLSLNSASGVFSGTPTQAGTFTFSMQVRDSSSTVQTATKQYTISIATGGPIPLSIVTTTLSNGQVNLIYLTSLSATGGVTPYHWSLLSGSLPAGLSLNASTGQISGTPTQTGSFPLQVQVTDSSIPNQAANQSLTLLISPPIVGTSVTSCGVLGNSGTTYVLQNDISSPGTCISISASNITFDLNGHTITYDTGGSSSVYAINETAYLGGITGLHITSTNGLGNIQMSNAACYVNIQTGPGQGKCATAHPVYLQNAEVDHLNITYYGEDSHGIFIYYGNVGNVHDNNLYPYHTKATLNHYSVMGEIDFQGAQSTINIQNNYIGGPNGTVGLASQTGMFIPFNGVSPSSPAIIKNNTINIAGAVGDGYGILGNCANASGVTTFEIANNTIAADRGILIDTYAAPGCNGGTIHDNTITVHESGDAEIGTGDATGIQTRDDSFNLNIYNNTVTANVGPGQCPAHFFTDPNSDCAGVGIKLNFTNGAINNQVYNNTVNVSSTDPANYPVLGLYGNKTAAGAAFHDNTVTSNSVAIAIVGGPHNNDGQGSNFLFQHNTLIKASGATQFTTFNVAYCCTGSSGTGNVLLDNTYQGGAAVDDIGGCCGTASANSYSYNVKWSYNVTVQNALGQPVPGATVTAVATGGGAETVSQLTDSAGNAQLVLTDHYVSGSSTPTTTAYTPHTVTILAPACTVSTSPFQLILKQPTSQTLVCQ